MRSRTSGAEAGASAPIVLRSGAPFVSLLKAVDLVISSGGTMLREAAYLGVPAYSILRSEIGQVDEYLESIGRLTFIESPESFGRIRLARAELDPLRGSGDLVASLTRQMAEVSARGRSAPAVPSAATRRSRASRR